MMFANKVNFFGKQSVIRIYKNISTFCNIMTFFTLTLLCVLSHYTVEIFSRIDKNKLPIWIQERLNNSLFNLSKRSCNIIYQYVYR